MNVFFQAVGNTVSIVVVGSIVWAVLKALKNEPISLMVIVLCGVNIVSVWLDVIKVFFEWVGKITSFIGI